MTNTISMVEAYEKFPKLKENRWSVSVLVRHIESQHYDALIYKINDQVLFVKSPLVHSIKKVIDEVKPKSIKVYYAQETGLIGVVFIFYSKWYQFLYRVRLLGLISECVG